MNLTHPKSSQQGAALIIGLILTLVGSIVAMSSMRGSSFQESMTANLNNKAVSFMAAEAGATAFHNWLQQTIETDGWPTNAVLQGAPIPKSFGDRETVSNSHGAYWFTDLLADAGASTITLNVVGTTVADDVRLAQSTISLEFEDTTASPFPNGMGDADAAFTCFGVLCSARAHGSATVDGRDYGLTGPFACQGNSCNYNLLPAMLPVLDAQGNAVLDENGDPLFAPRDDRPGAYLTDVENPIGHGGGTFSGDPSVVGTTYEGSTSLADWLGDATDPDNNGYVADLLSQVAATSKTLMNGTCPADGSSEAGSRANPRVFVMTADTHCNSKVSMAGVLIVEAGAALSFNGTFHFEGLIVIMPGGKADFSNGNASVYGAVVDLAGDAGTCGGNGQSGNDGCDLNISGNADIRYSSEALANLNNIGGSNSDPAFAVRSWRETL